MQRRALSFEMILPVPLGAHSDVHSRARRAADRQSGRLPAAERQLLRCTLSRNFKPGPKHGHPPIHSPPAGHLGTPTHAHTHLSPTPCQTVTSCHLMPCTQSRRPAAHSRRSRPAPSLMPKQRRPTPFCRPALQLPFDFARCAVAYDPKWDKITAFACNKDRQPLLVFVERRLDHAATQRRLLDHLATKLEPRQRWRRHAAGPPDVEEPIDGNLFTWPAVSVPNGGDHEAVCMHARPGHVDGFIYTAGYVQVLLGKDAAGGRVLMGAHRLLCWLYRGPPPDWHDGQSNMVAAHAYGKGRCNDARSCLQPCHLKWDVSVNNLKAARDQKPIRRCLCPVHLTMVPA